MATQRAEMKLHNSLNFYLADHNWQIKYYFVLRIFSQLFHGVPSASHQIVSHNNALHYNLRIMPELDCSA